MSLDGSGPGQRLGSGENISVFVNCPFDKDFAPLFNTLVFTIVCCGFVPRSAIDSGVAGDARMQRILEGIGSCKYSIHDLSRCRGEGGYNYARFNMPLELGMAMYRRFADRNSHEWFALVPAGHDYARYVSDLSGFDLDAYDGKEESIVRLVMGWLLTRDESTSDLEPPDVINALPAFIEEQRRLAVVWDGNVPWKKLRKAALDFVPE
jgi:hypothetical protein